MCTVCGCGTGKTQSEHKHEEQHKFKHDAHIHEDSQAHLSRFGGQEDGCSPHHPHHHGNNSAGMSVPGMSEARLVRLEQDILQKNNNYADANRSLLAERGILALNLVSSPGSGKTSLLVETLIKIGQTWRCYVIEGDQQTENDANRIRQTGIEAIQINTGKGCHLDGHMVGHALEHLQPEVASCIFIENVGNLVCPAAFDLGEAHKVAILSVTEGEDKPLKYPDMFAAADLVLLNKTDLLPHLDFDVETAIANAQKVNRSVKVLQVSARTGEGLEGWIDWIAAARNMMLAGHPTLGAAE